MLNRMIAVTILCRLQSQPRSQPILVFFRNFHVTLSILSPITSDISTESVLVSSDLGPNTLFSQSSNWVFSAQYLDISSPSGRAYVPLIALVTA